MGSDLRDRLRYWRSRAGLTQKQLAAAIGIDAASITRWQQGDVVPTTTRLLQVAEACGVDMVTFWGPMPEAPADVDEGAA